MKDPDDASRVVVMSKEKNAVALTSVLAAVVLTLSKLLVGLLTGSLGILSEAAHSGFDLLAAVITLFAVRIADRPPDREHQFGHGKFENLSALVETILLLVTCVWILYEAHHRLTAGAGAIDVTVYSFAVIGGSILIDLWRSRALSRVARKFNSQALEADALHFQSDIYSSAVVIVGLVCVKLGFPEGDAIAAALVACIVIWISVRLGKRTIDVLLDSVPVGADERVSRVIESVDGVENIQSLRLRQAGAKTFIDVVIAIHRLATFDQAHRIMDEVEKQISLAIPDADSTVHAEPAIRHDEKLTDAITWLVQQHGLIPHNVIMLDDEGSYHIQLDIEYPMGTTFMQAHARASQIETRIRADLPRVSEVSVHLEEEASEAIATRNVTGEEAALVDRIRATVRDETQVFAAEIVRCYRSHRGLKITVSCLIDAGLTLNDAHTVVSRIETAISALDSRIVKVFVHAEPAG